MFKVNFKTVPSNMSNCHVFCCLIFVLEPKLQNLGVNIIKWGPRSLIEDNMGFSEMHSTKFGLVLNILTGSISPQYLF